MEKNIFESAKKIIGFDLDNTTWDYVVPKNLEKEETIKFLIKNTNSSREKIEASMGKVYKKAGTPDFSGLVQNMDILNMCSLETKKYFIDEIVRICKEVRDKHLTLYPGIRDVLETLHQQEDVAVFAMSDAPQYQAITRSTRLGIAKYFDAIYAQKNENTEYVKSIMGRARGAGIITRELPNEKPNIDIAEQLSITKKKVEEDVSFVGNSLEKDLGLSYVNGNKSIIGKWGRSPAHEAKSVATLVFPKAEVYDMQLTQKIVEMIQGTRVRILDEPLEILSHI